MERKDFLILLSGGIVGACSLPAILTPRHKQWKLVSNKFLGTDPTEGFFKDGEMPSSIDPQYAYISRPYACCGDVILKPWGNDGA